MLPKTQTAALSPASKPDFKNPLRKKPFAQCLFFGPQACHRTVLKWSATAMEFEQVRGKGSGQAACAHDVALARVGSSELADSFLPSIPVVVLFLAGAVLHMHDCRDAYSAGGGGGGAGAGAGGGGGGG